MSGIGAIFNKARQAILVSQAGVETAGHNIANAGTPGYTRQRLQIGSAISVRSERGYVSSGVEVQGTERPRDFLIDSNFRRETSELAQYQVRSDTLKQIEAALADFTDAGITFALEEFFNTWSDLSVMPAGGAQKELVRQAGQILADRFNGMAARLDTTMDTIVSTLNRDVAALNRHLSSVASINQQILRSEAGGQIAPDLRDQRDRVLDQIAELVDIQVREDSSTGMVTVYSTSGALVESANALQFELEYDGVSTYSLQFAGTNTNVATRGGRIGEQVDLLNTRIPDIWNTIDQTAATLVSEVNALHAAGTASDTTTGINFFDPAGVTAQTMRLSTDIQAGSQYVMNGYSGASGDGTLAEDLAALRYTPIAGLGNLTIADYYIENTVSIGLQIDNADDVISVQKSILEQIGNQRSSVSDVSTDEELITLLRFQQSFQAAAKLVKTADEMMQTLLNL